MKTNKHQEDTFISKIALRITKWLLFIAGINLVVQMGAIIIWALMHGNEDVPQWFVVWIFSTIGVLWVGLVTGFVACYKYIKIIFQEPE